MMRVLHISKYFEAFTGGIETFTRDLLSACDYRNIRQAVVAHHHRRSLPTCTERVSLGELRALEVTRVRSFGQILYAPVAPGFGRTLDERAYEFSPDIVHVHMPNLSAFWLLRCKFLSHVPWVIHWHADVASADMSLMLRFAYSAYRPLEQRILQRAKRIVVTSPPYGEASKALSNWKDKCVVIPLGLDERHLAPPTRDEHHSIESDHLRSFATSDDLRLLFVGRLSSYKGIAYLVRAIKDIAGVKLAIAGEGEARDTIVSLIRDLNLETRAILLGQISEESKAHLMRAADLLCLPSTSRHEAFGMVLLEAMSCGTPVMATRVEGSGMQWVVEDQKTGWLVEPGNPSAIADLIRRLQSTPQLLASAGKAARMAFEQRFGIGPVADAIVDLYKVTVAEASGRNRK